MKHLRELFDRTVFLKRLLLFAVTVAAALLIYRLTINIFSQSTVLGLLAAWFAVAYLLLPRMHRILTKLYLPDYFIGRARTGEGILGDPINLAYNGSLVDLKKAMKQSGWIEADELNWRSTRKMITSTLRGRSYPNAPVSSLFLFGNKQAVAFQQEVGGSTKERHHVRFWKCPKGWKLPGGFQADYLGAATYDTSVGLSLYTFQITHKIEENTDIERDFVINTLKKHNPVVRVKVVKDYSSGYHHRNGGGDTIKTDGALPFIVIQ